MEMDHLSSDNDQNNDARKNFKHVNNSKYISTRGNQSSYRWFYWTDESKENPIFLEVWILCENQRQVTK